MKTRIVTGLVVLTFFLSSCYYDKEEVLYGSSTCISTGSTYSGTVSVILNQRCNSCHAGNSASASGGGIILDNYNSVKVYVDNTKLLGSINHASGYSQMPKNATKLSNCDISKITDWVNNGAPNN